MERSPIIVLVEDSATQSKAIATYLTQLGVNVVVANDGPPGLAAVAKYMPDAVILDVDLPSMNGYQIAHRIKRDPATTNIPVIMLTTHDTPSDMVIGLNHGADYYIPKGEESAEQLCRTLMGFGLVEWQ
ncbi:MAG: response regulator [Anaerolineae bacterium]|nr:response regulator [Anaerolineae bacterium]